MYFCVQRTLDVPLNVAPLAIAPKPVGSEQIGSHGSTYKIKNTSLSFGTQ